MKQKSYQLLFSAFLFLSFALFSQEAALPERPNPPRLVNNLSIEFPNFLSAAEQNALELKLVQFSDSTSNQIAVVIVDDLLGLEPEEYATAIGRKWGVGQADIKNGIVVLVKPTGGKSQRKIFIAPGYGLEGVIPDIAAKHIIEQEIVPRFKDEDYYGGLNSATDVLMSLAKGEYDYKSYNKRRSSENIIPVIVFLIFFIIIIIFRFRRSKGYTIGKRGMFYGAPFFGGGFGGGFGRGSSGGGGGFGGFGGGSFGGGGSGGSW